MMLEDANGGPMPVGVRYSFPFTGKFPKAFEPVMIKEEDGTVKYFPFDRDPDVAQMGSLHMQKSHVIELSTGDVKAFLSKEPVMSDRATRRPFMLDIGGGVQAPLFLIQGLNGDCIEHTYLFRRPPSGLAETEETVDIAIAVQPLKEKKAAKAPAKAPDATPNLE